MQSGGGHRLPPRRACLGRRRLSMDFWGQSFNREGVHPKMFLGLKLLILIFFTLVHLMMMFVGVAL